MNANSSNDKKIRLFIAAKIPPELKEALRKQQDKVRLEMEGSEDYKKSDISWTNLEQAHLTIKFLGETPEQNIPNISEALKRATKDIKAFEVVTSKIGAFPTIKIPKLIWVGIKENSHLEKLHDRVVGELSINTAKEKRFTPHLTICRVKDKRASKTLYEKLQDMRNLTFSGLNFTASELVLFKSELKAEGAIHTALLRIKI
ncbi:MAG: RNA 2',3'-cyclic phosphodiesterase [Deltaproteobacteria bacterium]|nr:RNA 2',3'-cyclic phosphodiesterase [Deltaproteobacteria bacterium]